MAVFSIFWDGFLVFIICCAIGFIMSYSGGKVIDEIHEWKVKTPLPGDTSDFYVATHNQVYWFINLYYALMYGIPVLGAAIFAQSIIKRVRSSQYTYRG
jgi:hypothetical protein